VSRLIVETEAFDLGRDLGDDAAPKATKATEANITDKLLSDDHAPAFCEIPCQAL
jgi:hypothetical protein